MYCLTWQSICALLNLVSIKCSSARNISELFAYANVIEFCPFPMATIVRFIARSFVFGYVNRKSLLYFLLLTLLFCEEQKILFVSCVIGFHRSQSQHIAAQASHPLAKVQHVQLCCEHAGFCCKGWYCFCALVPIC